MTLQPTHQPLSLASLAEHLNKRKQSSKFIEWKEFEALAESRALKPHFAARILHTWGIILHFDSVSHLDQLVILDADWLSKVIGLFLHRINSLVDPQTVFHFYLFSLHFSCFSFLSATEGCLQRDFWKSLTAARSGRITILIFIRRFFNF